MDKSDLYQIYNNYISVLVNDLNFYIHSVVISKDGYGILLLGTFDQGKTTYLRI